VEDTMSVKLAEVYRGDILESTHMGSIVAVNRDGEMLYELGDTGRVTFFHSAAKPLQALTVLEAGIVEEYGFGLKEIAVMASSHNGESEHIDVLKGIMDKLGVSEDILQCGTHEPLGKEAAEDLRAAGLQATRLHCNCSGKHLGFIAASKLKGLPLHDYHKVEHTIQKEVRNILSEFGNVQHADIVTGTDGCSVPVYGMPLRNMALVYARLCDESFADGRYRKSQNYILSAMTMYPEMIAGKDRFDTEIMKNFGDRVITKMGAEGVCCAGLPGKGVGFALKIEDGSPRAIEPVVLEALIQMEVIKGDEIEDLMKFLEPPIISRKQEKIGHIRANFRLK